MKKIFILFVLLFSAILMFAGCSEDAGEKLEAIKDAGKLVVYTDPNFPPFEFHGPDGIIGADIEIARAIADEIGVELELVEAEFDSILMAVSGGRGDIAITGMTITDERKESVDFSVPYINSVQYLILPADSDIAIMEDLAGKRVGVAFGYTGQWLMEDELDEEGVLYNQNTELVEYNSAMEASLDMQNGRIDAVVMDEFVALSIAAGNAALKSTELKYADGNVASEEYGVVIPKNNKDLVDVINKVIQRLLDENKIEEWVVQYGTLTD
ncbi:MAG: transporter substrate-binding domain-containing protein [Oscillospiraceae bacterium]|nr:transporter substrate-binding domain-containing protein [Oscillospiraceae bacterium]